MRIHAPRSTVVGVRPSDGEREPEPRSGRTTRPLPVESGDTSADHELARRLGAAFGLQKAGVFYALIGIIVAFELSTTITGKPNYLTLANSANVLQQASIPGVIAIFSTIVLITGNFDLSIASTAGLSAAIALRLIDVENGALVIVLCLAVGALVGVVNGFLVVYRRINAFIVTLGTLTIVRGLVYVASGETSVVATARDLQPLSTGTVDLSVRWIPVAVGVALLLGVLWRRRRRLGRFSLLGVLALAGLLIVGGLGSHGTIALNHSVLITLGLGILVWFVMRKTVLGRRLYAVGSNAEAARLAGVPVRRYQFGAFVVNGTGAAFAGLMLAGLYQAADPSIFTGQELVIITAAVIGGTSLFGGSGDVLKSLVGMVILAALTNGMNFQALSAAWQSTVQGIILILAAAVYTAQGSGRRRSGFSSLVGGGQPSRVDDPARAAQRRD